MQSPAVPPSALEAATAALPAPQPAAEAATQAALGAATAPAPGALGAAAPSFTSSLLMLALMVLALALLPWALRRWQQRQMTQRGAQALHTHITSAVVVGPQQRVLTVEIARAHASPLTLVLGVTPQSIQCLHVLDSSPAPAFQAPPACELPEKSSPPQSEAFKTPE